MVDFFFFFLQEPKWEWVWKDNYFSVIVICPASVFTDISAPVRRFTVVRRCTLHRRIRWSKSKWFYDSTHLVWWNLSCDLCDCSSTHLSSWSPTQKKRTWKSSYWQRFPMKTLCFQTDDWPKLSGSWEMSCLLLVFLHSLVCPFGLETQQQYLTCMFCFSTKTTCQRKCCKKDTITTVTKPQNSVPDS